MTTTNAIRIERRDDRSSVIDLPEGAVVETDIDLGTLIIKDPEDKLLAVFAKGEWLAALNVEPTTEKREAKASAVARVRSYLEGVPVESRVFIDHRPDPKNVQRLIGLRISDLRELVEALS